MHMQISVFPWHWTVRFIVKEHSSSSTCTLLLPKIFCDHFCLLFLSHDCPQEQQIIQRNFIFICDDNATIWLSVAYAYKGLLQLVAMFMAFHTRKIKIRALNDSKEIAAIVYINSIILVLLIVVEFALRQYHYVYASLYGLALLVGGSLFLGLTFIPKVKRFSKVQLLKTSFVQLIKPQTKSEAKYKC